MQIEAKVADLIGDTQIAINAGWNRGVTDKSDISLVETVEISDPDTNEPLGSILRIRARLRVSFVQDKLTVATLRDPLAAALGALGPTRRITNNRGRAQGNEDKWLYVNVGDRVLIEVPDPSDGKPG